jgi:hypothetical protein
MKVPQKLINYFNVNFLFKNLIVPIILLTIYCGSYAYLSPHFLTRGVNFYFTSRTWKYLILLNVIVCLITIIKFKLDKNNSFTRKKAKIDIYFGDAILILLPLTIVIQYIINNQSILSLSDSVITIVFFIFFQSSIFLPFLPYLISWAPLGF